MDIGFGRDMFGDFRKSMTSLSEVDFLAGLLGVSGFGGGLFGVALSPKDPLQVQHD